MKDRGRPPHNDVLTPAEWRVADAVRHGMTNPAIAKRLGVSTDAVKFHVSSVLGKLGLHDRKELRKWDGVRVDSALNQSLDYRNTGSDRVELGQVALQVSDVDRAIVWYQDMLGLPLLFRFDDMAFFDLGGARLYLGKGDPAQNPLLYYRTNDLHGMVSRLSAAGCPLMSAPHRIHVHEDGSEEWMAFLKDSEGTVFGLMTLTPFSINQEI